MMYIAIGGVWICQGKRSHKEFFLCGHFLFLPEQSPGHLGMDFEIRPLAEPDDLDDHFVLHDPVHHPDRFAGRIQLVITGQVETAQVVERLAEMGGGFQLFELRDGRFLERTVQGSETGRRVLGEHHP